MNRQDELEYIFNSIFHALGNMLKVRDSAYLEFNIKLINIFSEHEEFIDKLFSLDIHVSFVDMMYKNSLSIEESNRIILFIIKTLKNIGIYKVE